MNSKTRVTLVLFLVLGAAAYYVVGRPPKGQRQGPRDRPIPAIDVKKLDRIEISSSKGGVELVREKETWRIEKPLSYAADKFAIDSVVSKLEKLEFGDLVTELKAKHKELEVDKASSVHVKASAEGTVVADFFLGKAVDGHTMLRKADSNEVYQAVGAIRASFERETKGWRDRTILKVKKDDVVGLRLQGAAGTISVERKDAKDPWKVRESSITLDQLDTSLIERTVSSLSSFTATDFADQTKPEKSGLDKQATRLELATKDKRSFAVLIGRKDKDRFFVKRADEKQIFVVGKYTVENLPKRPIDFRDKSILSFKAEDATEVTVKRSEKGKASKLTLVRRAKSWLANGKKPQDEAKVNAAVSALASLKGDSFAEAPAKAYGLSQAGWSIEIKLKDRSRYRLRVGSKEVDGRYGVAREGIPDIFTLRKYAAERFLLDAAKILPAS